MPAPPDAGSGSVADAGAPAEAGETNLARVAIATASSETPAFGQTASKAIDGIVDGYPGDYTREWATLRGSAGSFLTLTWAAPVRLSRIVLHDRPNANDHVTASSLRFSDGSTIDVGALPNDGSPLTVALPAGAAPVTSVSLLISGVSTTTENIGLAEIEAWGR
jgi:hypothetical protein